MRQQAVVKKHLTVLGLQPNQKMTQYSCNHCRRKYAVNVTRMVKHLKDGCRSCPQTVTNSLKSPAKLSHRHKGRQQCHHCSNGSAETTGSDNSFIVEDVRDAGSYGTSKSTPSNKQNSEQPDQILKFCDTITKGEEKNLQKLLALPISASGTPLSVTENIYWKDFFAAARPCFKLSMRYELSNPLLDNAYAKVKNDVEARVASASTIGIQCDGWSNIRNEGIINFIVTTPKPVFFETISTETDSQTAESMVKKISEVIDKIGADKVFGVCTDNAAAMKKAWKILDDQYAAEKIAFYGCIAHILNLLIKDIADQPAVLRLVKNATAIVREIKDGHVISALFAQVQQEDEMSTVRPLSIPETEKVMSALKKRRDMALHPIHFAANILDPVYKGKLLTDEESMAGNQLIFELSIKFKLEDDKDLAELADYMVDQGVWSKNYVQRAISVTSAVNWWKGICNKTSLSKISVAILNLPPTSAATERSFSTYGWIHSTKRNRLTVKRAGMLTYITHNLGLQGKKTYKRELKAAPISGQNESDVESSEPEEEGDSVQDQDEAEDEDRDEVMDIETEM